MYIYGQVILPKHAHCIINTHMYTRFIGLEVSISVSSIRIVSPALAECFLFTIQVHSLGTLHSSTSPIHIFSFQHISIHVTCKYTSSMQIFIHIFTKLILYMLADCVQKREGQWQGALYPEGRS